VHKVPIILGSWCVEEIGSMYGTRYLLYSEEPTGKAGQERRKKEKYEINSYGSFACCFQSYKGLNYNHATFN
jgi:hypothetical protein